MNRGLVALAIGGFGIGLTEFVVMGLLPDIANGLHVTIPQAGYMISAYALGVVVGAPILTGLGGRFAPKNILMGLMLLFTVFNSLSAFSSNLTVLIACRFLSGLPHGAFFGVGAVVAQKLAKPGKEASAVSVMFAGLTIANVIGVPMATFIGHTLGWQWAFALVGLIGVATILSVRQWIPELRVRSENGILGDLQILKRPNLWLAICITSVGFGGFFAWMSYVAPLFTVEAKFAANTVPILMAVAGVGMTVGNWLGGKLSDRIAPLKAMIGLMLTMALVLVLNSFCSSSQIAMVVLTFLTGATAMALASPIQLLLISQSKGAEMFGASLGQSSFNIGNALGAYLGGIPLAMGLSYASPQWVGAAMSLVGVMIAGYLMMRLRKNKILDSIS